jgi:hypothetical protein
LIELKDKQRVDKKKQFNNNKKELEENKEEMVFTSILKFQILTILALQM